jgi:hypothetical protein
MLIVSRRHDPPKEGGTMFPDYHLMGALVTEHQGRLADGARKRRFLRAGRRANHEAATIRPDRTTAAVEAIPAAARQALPLGRTPSETHRAA